MKFHLHAGWLPPLCAVMVFARSGLLLSLVFLFLSGWEVSAAQPTVDLKPGFQKIRFGKFLQFRKDETGKESFASILAKRDWKKSEKDSLGLGFTRAVSWVRFRLRNLSDETRLIMLQQEYPLLDDLTLYRQIPGTAGNQPGHFIAEATGDYFRFQERPYPKDPTFIFPVKLPAGSGTDFYLRIATTSSMNISIVAWEKNALEEHEDWQAVGYWLFVGIMAVMFVFNIIIFFVVKERVYIYYSMFTLGFLLFSMSMSGAAFKYLWPNSIWWNSEAIPMFIAVSAAGLCQFFRHFVRLSEHMPFWDRFMRVFYWICLAVAALTLPISNYRLTILFGTGAPVIIGPVCFIIAAFLSVNVRAARYFIFAFSVFLGGAFIFAMKALGYVPENFLTANASNIGAALSVTILSIGLADRINRMRRELQILNSQLEDKVKERTRQLQSTLEEVNALKEQQDGDYYLTSLLLKPLGQNHASHPNVQVEFYVKQKKQFTFRRWETEIGGDLCMANEITLRGRKFTVFLNGDAMGKSIQGAGGALVLGAVFLAIIERTLALDHEQNHFPERWLKNSFLELQKVFESFDGSMLVSVTMGLVDCDNGLLYYINAEHPFTILYRDNKAEFLEQSMLYRKLGMPNVSYTMVVQTFQMSPGDKVIIGSDGKDDLLLGVAEDGSRNINENERLVLEAIEKSEADLDRIAPELMKSGELTDDFSLLAISFKGVRRATGEEPLKQPAYLRQAEKFVRLGKKREAREFLREIDIDRISNVFILDRVLEILIDLKDFAYAAHLSRCINDLAPENIRYLYITSFCYLQMGDYEQAADFGERVFLRAPDFPDNLETLGRTYLALNNGTRARYLFERMLNLIPGHKSALAAIKLLERKEKLTGRRS